MSLLSPLRDSAPKNFYYIPSYPLQHLSTVPETILLLLQAFPETLVLAGGSLGDRLADRLPRDYDFFISENSPLRAEVEKFFSEQLQTSKVTYSQRATTFAGIRGGLPIQLVHLMTFASPEDLLPHFDFTVSMAALWWPKTGNAWKLLVHQTWERDVLTKALTYTPFSWPAPPSPDEIKSGLLLGGNLDPAYTRNRLAGSLLRVLRFTARGYTITPLEYGKVVFDFTTLYARLDAAAKPATALAMANDFSAGLYDPRRASATSSTPEDF